MGGARQTKSQSVANSIVGNGGLVFMILETQFVVLKAMISLNKTIIIGTVNHNYSPSTVENRS